MTPTTTSSQERSTQKPKLVILYGSQTGNAKRLAEQITLQAYQLFRTSSDQLTDACLEKCALSVYLSTMDNYKPVSRLLTEDGIILFVCSTTGYGIAPDNMSQFWRRLMHRNLKPGSSLPPQLRFAVIGLGDSSYPNFNHTSKKLYRRMSQLGASPLVLPAPSDQIDPNRDGNALCLLDDQAELGYDWGLSLWIPCFWKCISQMYNLSLASEFGDWPTWSLLDSSEFVSKTWPKFRICCYNQESETTDNKEDSDLSIEIQKLISQTTLNPVLQGARLFTVNHNQRVTTEDHFQDTRLIGLSYASEGESDQQLSDHFEPGALIFIQPRNPINDVIQLFKLTKSTPSDRVTVSQKDPNFPLPTMISDQRSDLSLAWLASYYFDLMACPSKSFIKNLATLARDAVRSVNQGRLGQFDRERLAAEAERLQDLCSSEFVDDLNDYVFRPRRSVIEILTDFPTTSSFLSPYRWFDVLPGPIYARPYSIASAPPSIEILVAVVSYKTLIAAPRRGLTSNFLASLCPGDHLTGWISNDAAGSFHFGPALKAPNPPCLLIAPGTGVAPFRSLLWHQAHVLDPSSISRNYLFFGCRYSNKDFYFSSEWQELDRKGLLKLVTAFSREKCSASGEPLTKSSGKPGRTYVQDMLLKYPTEVWSILGDPRGLVYIVANAKSMPTEVKQVLVTIAQEQGHLSKDQAELHLVQMENDDRFQVEAWA